MIKKILTYVLIVLGFLVVSYGFVPEVLGGKIVNQSDISGYVGMSHEMSQWNAAHPSDETAWTGSMFGGMPTAAIHSSTKGDWTQFLYDLLLTGKRPATYLFISLLGAFLLMLSLGISPLIAVGGAIAVTFCAYNLQIIQVGHNTKMQAIAFMPWVLAALVFTYRSALERRKWLPWTSFAAALFALALSFQVKANHPQITYYLALMILIYAITVFVGVIRSEERKRALVRFFSASALLLVLGLAGIATNATKLLPTYEYTPYSMRGGSSSGETKGLDLGYATAWSYGWEELPNLMIPNFNGGASAGAVNPKSSATYALLKQAGQPNAEEICENLPLYWGPQPFTAGPMYMGAITVFLFVLGLLLYKRKERWWLLAATILAILLAVGNHLMWFTAFFYKFAPMYNKFRTVSMALTMLQVTLPLLGFLVLDSIVKDGIDRKEFLRKGGIALGLTGGISLLFVLLPGLAGSFSGASDSGQQDILVAALQADRRHLLVMDALKSALLIAASFGLLFWGISVPSSARETFRKNPEMGMSRRRTAALLICLLVFVDMFAVGKRYLNSDDFVTKKTFNNQFTKRPVDEMILADTDPSYRVLDLSVNVFNDSHPSYWHKNIGGYSPAKLQRYQEYIDSHLTKEINSLYKAMQGAATVEEAEAAIPYLEGLSKLNCRYIILGANVPPVVNRYAKGPAWFESGEGAIEMTSYAPNELRYHYSSPVSQEAVFSEVYYPAGWSLRLADSGEELEISLKDELFRSAVLPAGEHDLVMRFDPASYRIGEGVSRATSILIILVVLLSAGLVAVPEIRKKKEE